MCTGDLFCVLPQLCEWYLSVLPTLPSPFSFSPSLPPSLPLSLLLVKVYSPSKLEARDSPKLYSEPQEHHGQSLPGKSEGVVREKRKTSTQSRSSEHRLTQVLVREGGREEVRTEGGREEEQRDGNSQLIYEPWANN